MKHRNGSSRALRLSLVLALAVTAPRTMLHAQDVAYAASLTDLDSATQAVLGKEIALARTRGLPVDPLIAKVREGRLKRAPSARIRAAVERLSERLGAAREALGPFSTPEEVTAGADAIAAGAQASSLRAVRAATAQPVTAPIGALAQLLASGVAETKAVEMVLSLLRRNASPATLIALGNQVETDVATGLSAAASAAFRMRAIENQLHGLATDAATGGYMSTGTNINNNGTGSAPRRKP
jgi:hypothetical protein